MSGEKRPHFKTGGTHRPNCRCHACWTYRRRQRAADALDRLAAAERRAAEEEQ